MQPVLYSVTEASQGRPGWVRTASSVCYYRNLYINVEETNDVQQTQITKTVAENTTPTSSKNSLKKSDNEAK